MIAAQREHDAKNFLSRAWHTLTEDKPKVCREAMKAAETTVLSLMKRLHLNIVRTRSFEKSAALDQAAQSSAGSSKNTDPLRESKADLRALLDGEELADKERQFRAQFLLPALGRPPLYVLKIHLDDEGEVQPVDRFDERRWLAARVPQKLFFGSCEAPESRAALIIELNRIDNPFVL